MYSKMNKAQILLAFSLIVCCCITLSTSLRCYICYSSGQNCNNSTTTGTCNPVLARQTVNYGLQYLNATSSQLNATSSTYRCVYDYLSTGSSNHTYLGCAFNSLDICKFTPQSYTNRRCGWCSGDDCNRSPAGRANVSVFTVIATIILACVAKTLYS